MTDKFDEAVRIPDLKTALRCIEALAVNYPYDRDGDRLFQKDVRHSLMMLRGAAWKIERFDALAKAEAEGEIAIVQRDALRERGKEYHHDGYYLSERDNGWNEAVGVIRAAGPSKYLTKEG